MNIDPQILFLPRRSFFRLRPQYWLNNWTLKYTGSDNLEKKYVKVFLARALSYQCILNYTNTLINIHTSFIKLRPGSSSLKINVLQQYGAGDWVFSHIYGGLCCASRPIAYLKKKPTLEQIINNFPLLSIGLFRSISKVLKFYKCEKNWRQTSSLRAYK